MLFRSVLSLIPSVVAFKAGGTTYASVPLTYSGNTAGLTGSIIDCGLGNPADFPAEFSMNRQKYLKEAGVESPEASRKSWNQPFTPKADNSIQSAAEAAWGSYDPSKYEYRMNNGVLQRKKK